MGLERHILVDGYNCLHAWPQGQVLLRRNRDAARQAFVDALKVLHEHEKIRLTVVFDGQGDQLTVERPGEEVTFSVLYTPAGLSADGLIEQLARKANPRRTEVTVFSQDNLVVAGVRSAGGLSLPPDALWEWLERCERQQEAALQRRRARNARIWKDDSPWDAL